MLGKSSKSSSKRVHFNSSCRPAACNFTKNNVLDKHYSRIWFNFWEHPFQGKVSSGCFCNAFSYQFFFQTLHKIEIENYKNYNKMKLRLKLKFVNNNLCLGSRYGFFYKLYKLTCRSLCQTQFDVTDIILVSLLNFEQI